MPDPYKGFRWPMFYPDPFSFFEELIMADPTNLLTSAKIAEQLGASPAKVKKAIDALGIEPAAKKGICNYYDADDVKKIKGALK